MSSRHLPYVDPQKPRGVIYRAYAWLVGTRAVGWLSRRVVWKLDPLLLRLSGRRMGMGLLLPTSLLETRGARTGDLRRNGVIYFHDGERGDDHRVEAGSAAAPGVVPQSPGPPQCRARRAAFLRGGHRGR